VILGPKNEIKPPSLMSERERELRPSTMVGASHI